MYESGKVYWICPVETIDGVDTVNLNVALSVRGDSVVSQNRDVFLYKRENINDQLWLVTVENGFARIKSTLDTDYALNIYLSTGNCDIHTWADNLEDSKINFRTIDPDQNTYRIQSYRNNMDNNLYLTASKAASGGLVTWMVLNKSPLQKWQLVEANGSVTPPIDHNTVQRGVDTAATCSKTTCQSVADDGNRFIGRYLSLSAWKTITNEEAAQIHAAGLKVVCFYEDRGNEAEQTYDNGQSHAMTAIEKARAANQPSGSAIYFAIDYDATDAQMENIVAYFRGIQKHFADVGNPYVIGVYGSGAVCQKIKQDLHIATFSYLSRSYGWRGYQDYKARKAYDVLQGDYVHYNGVQFDSGKSSSAVYGQW